MSALATEVMAPEATTEVGEKYSTHLMWVGAESYPTIEDFAKEAMEMGVSKRLPNAHFARSLVGKNAIVFLAHHENEWDECSDCLGDIECPEDRKRNEAIKVWESEMKALATKVEKLEKDVAALPTKFTVAKDGAEYIATADTGIILGSGATQEAATDNGQKALSELLRKTKLALGQAKRGIKVREEKVEQAIKDNAECAYCGGKGHLHAGTGGSGKIDGVHADGRKINYYKHQPEKFDWKTRVTDYEMCASCGGFGRVPKGKLFGLFIPEAVEYILKDGETDAIKDELDMASLRTVPAAAVASEDKRGCGKRKSGGFYLVSGTGKEGATKAALDKLVKAGVINPESAINGSFAQFVNHVAIDGVKRFRGIKSWTPSAEADAEASMIIEALA